MSALAEEPNHFLNWVRIHHNPDAGQRSFLPRALYGRYIESLVAGSAVGNGTHAPSWLRDEAVSLVRNGDIFTSGLRAVRACLPSQLSLRLEIFLRATPIFQVSRMDRKDSFLLHGHRRRLKICLGTQAYSWLALASPAWIWRRPSTREDSAEQSTFCRAMDSCPSATRNLVQWPQFWHRKSPRTARGLLRLIRDQVRDAAAAGIDWRGVIDALRPATQDIWQSLSLSERRRFLRHVRAYWEIHRHRIAPEIDDVISRLRADGRLQIHPGRITNYAEHEKGAEIAFRCRKSGGSRRLLVDRVINCTGSEVDCRRTARSALGEFVRHRNCEAGAAISGFGRGCCWRAAGPRWIVILFDLCNWPDAERDCLGNHRSARNSHSGVRIGRPSCTSISPPPGGTL